MSFEDTGMIEVPMQRRINYVALATAILAAILAVVGIVLASNADTHAGEVGGKMAVLDKAHKAYVEVTDKNLNGIHVELSADATAIADLGKAVDKLESKSVVAELAKELREGKASKVSVNVLRDEILLKADAKTVKRLARRLNGFNDRLVKVEGIVLPKNDEPKTIEQPREEPPVAKPAPTPQPLPPPPAPVPPTPAKSLAPPAK